MATDPEKPTRRGLSFTAVVVLTCTLLTSSGALYAAIRAERELRGLRAEVASYGPRFEAFKEAVRSVERAMSSVVYRQIDLTAPGWQAVGETFYLTDLGVAPDPAGAKVSGKVINATALAHRDLTFSVRVKQAVGRFTLPEAPSGVAIPFEVLLPKLGAGDARQAFVHLESSRVSFASSATKKTTAPEPLETDKLLR